MKRLRGNSAAAAIAALILGLSIAPARAQTAADRAAAAEALFQEGRALVEAGKLAEACPKFEASQKLDPGYGTLWNLADCLEQTGRTASAWAAFREAAEMARKAEQAERVEKAERRATELAPRLERLQITVKQPTPGIEVRYDGALLAPAAWGTALPVDPGRHKVEAVAPGKQPFSLEVQTAGPGRTATAEIPPLADAAAAAPPVSAPVGAPVGAPVAGEPAGDGGASTRRTLAYVAGGVGLVGVAVGAIFGLSASSSWSEAQDEHCRTDTLCDGEGVALVDEAKTAAGISTAGFVVGGVGLAAGAALFLTSLSGDRPAAQARRLSIAPAAGPGGGGLVVRGRF